MEIQATYIIHLSVPMSIRNIVVTGLGSTPGEDFFAGELGLLGHILGGCR